MRDRGHGGGRIGARRRGVDVQAEIEHHIQERADLLVAEGWEPRAALDEARRRFGDVEEIAREMRALDRGVGAGLLTSLRSAFSDTRYALRGLAGAPAFSVAVVVTLALGIGSAASIFSVADAILLRPLEYRDADRWVEVGQARDDGGYVPGLRASVILEWRDASEGVLGPWIAYSSTDIVRTDGDLPERLLAVGVTPGAHELLGIQILRGRGLEPEDAVPGAPQVALLTERYWERLERDPGIVGRTIRLESVPTTVVGVVATDTRFPPTGTVPDLWLPVRTDFSYADQAAGGMQGVWARLPETTSITDAQDRVDVLARRLQEQAPRERGWRLRLLPLASRRANPAVERTLGLLAATVGAIFLIALVNGVNLVLVRATTRSRELALRAALGASRARLLRQLLVEGLVLGALAGLAAVALAWSAVAALRPAVPSTALFSSPHAILVEERTLLFAFATSLAAGVVLGLLPALHVLRGRKVFPALAGQFGDRPRSGRRIRNALLVGQVALSTTLLATAGLLVNGAVRLARVDPGFDYRRVVLADMFLSPVRYSDGPSRAAFAARVEDVLEAHPEVEAVTLISGSGFAFDVTLQAEGDPAPGAQPDILPSTAVDPDYFETVGTPIVAGRALDASDAGTKNVVVDRDLAGLLWGGAEAVGRRFRIDAEREWLTVVGVVEELRLMGRDQRAGPYQFLRARDPSSAGDYLEIALRASGPPEALLPVFQRTLREIDPQQGYWRLRTGARALAEEEELPRFTVVLMGALSLIAVTLAAVGLYGVLAYSVTRRNRELGIRMALGAERTALRTAVLADGMALAAVGVVLGLVGSLQSARIVEHLLYDVEPTDPATLAATALLLLAIAAAASSLPARRATRIDPVEVLKAE